MHKITFALLVVSLTVSVQSSEVELKTLTNDPCPLCTDEQRNQLALIEAQALAEDLISVLKMVDEITGHGETAEVLLADGSAEDRLLKAIEANRKEKRAAVRAKMPKAAPKPTSPVFTGLEGLVAAYASKGDRSKGYVDQAIVLSHGKAVALAVLGQSFRHNGKAYRFSGVDERRDDDGALKYRILLLDGEKKIGLEWAG